MSAFADRLAAARGGGRRDGSPSRWVFVPSDQLTDSVGPLSETKPEELGVILIETNPEGLRRPDHKQKIVMTLASQRHFAIEQARRSPHDHAGIRKLGPTTHGTIKIPCLLLIPTHAQSARDAEQHVLVL